MKAHDLDGSGVVKHPEASFVIKYFDLIDEFIKVRCCSEELLSELHSQAITNKASYRQRVVRSCVPTFEAEILAAVGKMDEDYDIEIVEELLYQICIDVNPSLEIHQVSIPSPNATAKAENDEIVRPNAEAHRQLMYRRVNTLERQLRAQIIGQRRSGQAVFIRDAVKRVDQRGDEDQPDDGGFELHRHDVARSGMADGSMTAPRCPMTTPARRAPAWADRRPRASRAWRPC